MEDILLAGPPWQDAVGLTHDRVLKCQGWGGGEGHKKVPTRLEQKRMADKGRIVGRGDQEGGSEPDVRWISKKQKIN